MAADQELAGLRAVSGGQEALMESWAWPACPPQGAQL